MTVGGKFLFISWAKKVILSSVPTGPTFKKSLSVCRICDVILDEPLANSAVIG